MCVQIRQCTYMHTHSNTNTHTYNQVHWTSSAGVTYKQQQQLEQRHESDVEQLVGFLRSAQTYAPLQQVWDSVFVCMCVWAYMCDCVQAVHVQFLNECLYVIVVCVCTWVYIE